MDEVAGQTVVETGPYLAAASKIVSLEEQAKVVDMIAQNPDAGDLMIGTGGLRKVRIPLEGRGKRGGGRLITYFYDREMPVFLVAVYPKNTQGDLDAVQRKAALAVTDAIRAQYGRK